MPKLKYKISITDNSNTQIIPKFSTGTVAEHFAACVYIYIDIINGGVIRSLLNSKHAETASMSRSLISKLLPGGRINEGLMKIFNDAGKALPFDEGVPVLFLGDLHKHKELTPDAFLTTWGNSEIVELRRLMQTRVADIDVSIELFIKFLTKVKIPGLGQCKIEAISLDAKVADTKTAADHKLQNDSKDEQIIITHPVSSDDYVIRLQAVIGKQVTRMSITQVSFFKTWLQQLGDDAINELRNELQISDSLIDFKKKFAK